MRGETNSEVQRESAGKHTESGGAESELRQGAKKNAATGSDIVLRQVAEKFFATLFQTFKLGLQLVLVGTNQVAHLFAVLEEHKVRNAAYSELMC